MTLDDEKKVIKIMTMVEDSEKDDDLIRSKYKSAKEGCKESIGWLGNKCLRLNFEKKIFWKNTIRANLRNDHDEHS